MAILKSSMSRTVLKAMSVFGGVQVLSILCSIVRNKLVAIWLGPAGVGLFAIFIGAQQTIESAATLQVGQSAVRDISAVSDARRRNRLIVATRRWGVWLGLLGLVAMCALSPLLSMWSFGNTHYSWAFCVLSLAVLCNSVAATRQAILRGLRQLSKLASSQVVGVFGALAVAVPLIYWLRMDSVVWVIVGSAAVLMVSAILHQRQRGLPHLTVGETAREGRSFLHLGLYLTFTSFLSYATSYVFVSYLTHFFDASQAGLYRAGFTIVNSYVGLVFTSISMEYYPRLTSQVHSHWRTQVIVSHEMRLALWILMPVICVFVAADSLVVRLLYSSEFTVITPFITLAMGGIVLKAVSWCMAFEILARGDGKIYVVTETISELLLLGLNVTLYNFYGFVGLGVAYILWYVFYTIIIWYVYRYRYGLRLCKGLWSLVALALVVTAVAISLRMWLS